MAQIPVKQITGAVEAVPATLGDGSSLTYAFVHGLNTYNVILSLRLVAAPRSEVGFEFDRTDLNTVLLRFVSAPAANSLAVVAMGVRNS